MTDVVTFPDIEAFAVGYLSEKLSGRMGADVKVDTRMPTPRPPLAVKPTRVGGVRVSKMHDRPMLWIECWSDDDAQALELATWARAELGAVDDTDPDYPGVAYHGETGGVSSFEDPESRSPRYVFTVEMSVRGTVA